jgi:CTP-dependent riboflavin kinase
VSITPAIRIDNPNDGPHDCDARCYPVSIDGRIDAAIVLPEVAGYSPAQIEIIAAMGVRDALDIDDGDSLRLEIR